MAPPRWALPEWDLQNRYALQRQQAKLNALWQSPPGAIDLTPEMRQVAREVAEYKRRAAAAAPRKRKRESDAEEDARAARERRARELARRVVDRWRARVEAVDPRTLERIEPSNKVRVGASWQSASGIGEGLKHGLYRNALTQQPLDERVVFRAVRSLEATSPRTKKRLAAERGERARHRAVVARLPAPGTAGYGAARARLVAATPAKSYTATARPRDGGGPSVAATSDTPVFALTGLRPRTKYVARVGAHMHDGTYRRGGERDFTSRADGTYSLRAPAISAGRHELAPVLRFPAT